MNDLNIPNVYKMPPNVVIQLSGEEFMKLVDIYSEAKKPTDESQPKNEETQILTVNRVCEKLEITRVTLWDWDKKGITKPIRLGNLKRYRLSDIEELLKKKEVKNG